MRQFLAIAAIAASCLPPPLCAQFTDPRTYTPGVVGTNDLEFDYTYARANASIDTSLVIGSATLELNKGDLSYTHNFSLLGHFAWVNALRVSMGYTVTAEALDISTPTGARALEARVSQAAMAACQEITRRFHNATPADAECARQATEKAMA
jgi:UrcA family protein